MEYDIIYSKRRTLCIEVTREAKVIVRCPYRTPKKYIGNFINERLGWIEKSIEKQKSRPHLPSDLSVEQINALKKSAREKIFPKVEYYSKIMGVVPEHISVNSAKTRFGSCSGKNRLNFSCRLMLYPEAAIDYVVVHELAHIKHHNHSKDFWAFVKKFMPDYKERKKLLK